MRSRSLRLVLAGLAALALAAVVVPSVVDAQLTTTAVISGRVTKRSNPTMPCASSVEVRVWGPVGVSIQSVWTDMNGDYSITVAASPAGSLYNIKPICAGANPIQTSRTVPPDATANFGCSC